MEVCNYEKHVEFLHKITEKLSSALGELDHLQSVISQEIEALSELRGEVCERAEKVAQALDLNRKEQTHENNQRKG